MYKKNLIIFKSTLSPSLLTLLDFAYFLSYFSLSVDSRFTSYFAHNFSMKYKELAIHDDFRYDRFI